MRKPFLLLCVAALFAGNIACHTKSSQTFQTVEGAAHTAPAAESQILAIERFGEKFGSQFDNIIGYTEGILLVYKADKYGYADTNGKLLTPIRYERASEFHNGYAGAQSTNGTHLLNTQGADVFPPRKDLQYMGPVDSRGWAIARNQKEKNGFINVKGETMIPFDYDDFGIEGFNGGVVIALKDQRYGLLTDKNEWIAKPVYDRILSFEEGVSVTPVQQNGNWGLIRRDGSLAHAVTMPYEEVGSFGAGLAVVTDKANLKGFIDTAGKEVIKPVYNLTYGFSKNGLAVVHVGEESYLIDRNGQASLRKGYFSIEDVGNDKYVVTAADRSKVGLTNGKGDILWPVEYISIMQMGDDLFLVKHTEAGPMYYANGKGEKVASCREKTE